MIDSPAGDLIGRLEAAARAASTAEETFRRDFVERMRTLERTRVFAFRRLNLVKAVVDAMAEAEDEADAIARGKAAFLRELNWSGASESQRDVLRQFQPVIEAAWRMQQADAPQASGDVLERELAAFETWFGENRNGSFLSLMDGEVLELPLVEV